MLGSSQCNLMAKHGNFLAVTFDVVERAWKTVGCHQWRRGVTLSVGEARACLYAAKHTLRSTHNFRNGMSFSVTLVSLGFVECVSRLGPVFSHWILIHNLLDTERVEPK